MSIGWKKSQMSNTANDRRSTARQNGKEIMMKGTILHGPRDIRLEERDALKIVHPTDADHPHCS
jgi:hypothetical protein